MPLPPIGAALLDFGAKFASDAIGAELGYNRHKRLQRLQIRGAKELADYNVEKQLDVWNRTNYGPQMEHLDKAGLNPALLYGMGGSGGATTGTGAAGMPTGAQAPQSGPHIEPMAMQLSLMEAQRENIQADTKLKNTTADKQAGIDTKEAEERINNLAQQTDNARIQYNIYRLEESYRTMDNWVKEQTMHTTVEQINNTLKQAVEQLQIIKNSRSISDATIQDEIKYIRQTAIGAALENELTKGKTTLTDEQSRAIKQQVKNWVQENMQKWDQLDQKNKELLLQSLKTHFDTDPVNKATENLSRIIDNIFIISRGLEGIPKREPIGFKR